MGLDEFVDHECRIFAEHQLSAVFQRRLKARALSAVASIAEIDVRVDNQRTGLPSLRRVHPRLDLVDSANGSKFRKGCAGRKDANG